MSKPPSIFPLPLNLILAHQYSPNSLPVAVIGGRSVLGVVTRPDSRVIMLQQFARVSNTVLR